MNKLIYVCFAILCSLCLSCANDKKDDGKETNSQEKGTFGYDLNFLQQHDSVVVLKGSDGQSAVIVSPKYQGKVFTSTAEGERGKSFGWINYKAFAGPLDSHMNAYGGENRLWLGPEGGPFSLFFPKGAAMTFANWKTPAAFDTESWSVEEKAANSVRLQKKISVTNYAGVPLQVSIDRTISILEKADLEKMLGATLDTSVKAVGYKTINTITNSGNSSWNEETGAPCLWMLDMFNPSPQTTIVIPYEESTSANEKAITTNYFGEIDSNRIKHGQGTLFFKADGKSRGKLGIKPLYAKPVAGSYDAASNLLTIALFDVEKDGNYLNQEWVTNKPPYTGDAVNAYNDGPLSDGKQMGPFYEIESVSPAAFLKPNTSLTHSHSVFHFTGDKESLNKLSEHLLGISLEEVQKAL